MRSSAIPLGLLFSALLATSCGFGSTGDGCGDATNDRDETVTVDEATFAMYTDADGNLDEASCQQLCMDQLEGFDSIVEWTECSAMPVAGSTDQEVHCVFVEEAICVGGRDGACIESRSTGIGPDPVAAWLGGTTHAEAASVRAFIELGRELAAHEAPAQLVDRAKRAARDEVAHARLTGRLAAARGGKAQRLKFRDTEPRGLEEIATENAVEGCVTETWSALVACHQARAAKDPEIRRAMQQIAEDETRHAELARSIDAWARTALDDDAIARIDAARAKAVANLIARLSEPDPVLAERAGLPAREVALRLAAGLRETIWA